MLDQPEVFISPDSPYKGAKPDDIAAISNLLRSTTAAALEERGYSIVDKPGADTLYVRLAVTDLQVEIQDSMTNEVLSAAVIKRGKGADVDKRISFDVLVASADLLGKRFACRLDNARVPAAQRIDCTDPVARESRPRIVGQ